MIAHSSRITLIQKTLVIKNRLKTLNAVVYNGSTRLVSHCYRVRKSYGDMFHGHAHDAA